MIRADKSGSRGQHHIWITCMRVDIGNWHQKTQSIHYRQHSSKCSHISKHSEPKENNKYFHSETSMGHTVWLWWGQDRLQKSAGLHKFSLLWGFFQISNSIQCQNHVSRLSVAISTSHQSPREAGLWTVLFIWLPVKCATVGEQHTQSITTLFI